MVTENFASLKVFIGEFSILVHEEVQKTLFFSFLSNLGAALNLWAGITIVLIVEVIEMVIRLVFYKEVQGDSCDVGGKEVPDTRATPNGLSRNGEKGLSGLGSRGILLQQRPLSNWSPSNWSPSNFCL